MRTVLLTTVLAGLAACSSLTPVNDPVYLRITDVEARLMRIERVLENESLISLAGDISSLRNELQTLIGDVETLRFELENQGQRQRDLYVDLDERLRALEQAGQRAAMMPGGPPVAGQPGAVGDQQAYDAAFALVQSRRYADAQAAFENFLRTYPSSPMRANAQYWLAETLYAQLSFQEAVAEFQRVIDLYPDSNKVADALVKIGFSHDELGNLDAARQALLRVTREFPNTSAADTADQRLTQIASRAR